MKKYQLFCLDHLDHIVRTEDFDAENDADAQEKATIHCGDHFVELWADDHRVSRYRPSVHSPACIWKPSQAATPVEG
jgi:hypothetical protein